MVRKALSQWTLDDWQHGIYRRNEKDYEPKSSADAWLRFAENATSRIAEFVRREEHGKTLEALARAFAELCCFVGHYRQERQGESFYLPQALSVMVWGKYPGVCYHCAHYWPEQQLSQQGYLPCMCLAIPDPEPAEKIQARNKRGVAASRKPRPQTIDDWAAMIQQVYGGTHKHLPIAAVCLHFLEEVGEVAKALRELNEFPLMANGKDRLNKIAELEEEIADVFSWIFGLTNKLQQGLQQAGQVGSRTVSLTSKLARDALRQDIMLPVSG